MIEGLEQVIKLDNVDKFKEFIWDKAKDILFNKDYNLLHYAISKQAVGIVEFILKTDYYDINEQTNDKYTALTLAMSEYNKAAEEIVEMIFKYYPDVDVDIPNKYGRNAVLVGLMSGISNRYILMAAEKTKNLEQLDTDMNETVVKACLRDVGMYRMHAQVLALYIRKGAKIDRDDIYKIMILSPSKEHNSVWDAIDGRKEFDETVSELAIEKGCDNFLPDTVKDIFIF